MSFALLKKNYDFFDLFNINNEFKNVYENSGKDFQFNWGREFSFKENDDHYIFLIDLPGIKKEEIDLEVEEKLLKLKAKRISQNLDSEGRPQVIGTVDRKFRLPENADLEKFDAVYEDGVLKLALGKNQPHDKKIKININPEGNKFFN